ncbi:MAG: DmsC/YnfH family molybdoenzyme membrane anchor subunit [Pirellulales bacterium]
MTATALLPDAPPDSEARDRLAHRPLALLAQLLDDQQDLSAVERFAQRCETETGHSTARFYRDLLPAAPPKDGEQYAFEVDLDLCSGCKACVTACHNLNGLDDGETFRDVGILHGGVGDSTVIQHVTTACHHCLEPACMQACPVNAYEKDPLTGIVRHLDDQCFGCQYCTLACPYDVPKYNRQKGIVRKCDMCSQRLAVGEPPACAQACPHQAIRIRTVSRQEVVQDCETNLFLPGAPEPQHTLPTTNYKTRRPLPRNLLPADYFSVQANHSHPALVVMLVLTQLSVGTFLVDYLLQEGGMTNSALAAANRPYQAGGALVAGIVALAASTLHLGRPQYAFRAVVGLSHSWLSREIVCFSAFALLAAVYAVASWQRSDLLEASHSVQRWLGGAVVLAGLSGVACSVMIYRSTRRPCWTGPTTPLKFFLTTAVLGSAGSLLLALVPAALTTDLTAATAIRPYAGLGVQALLLAAVAKLACEALQFVHLGARNHTVLKRSAMLMIGPLRRWTIVRFALGLLGVACLLALRELSTSASETNGPWLGVAVLVGFTSLLAGELCERHLFFTASVAPRMPGGIV